MKKYLFAYLLPALLLGFFIPHSTAAQNHITVDGIQYTYYPNTKTATVLESNSYYYSGDIVIPKAIDVNGESYSVTEIGKYAFKDCIDLTSITIPKSITRIDQYAFSSCAGLTSIKVDSQNSVYDSRNDCNAIIHTTRNELICGCSQTKIPETVTRIGLRAFFGCTGLTSITIPNSVIRIESQAFQRTGLTSVAIPSSVTIVGSQAFFGCIDLTSITIPNNFTNIQQDTFGGCTGLTSITIPNSVTIIGQGAFSGCSGLTSITIPNSVTSIGSYAFEGCTNLTSISIGNSVSIIGNDAFTGCTGLTSVKVESENPVYDSRDNCNAIIRTNKNELVYGCSHTKIPETVTSIGYLAFNGCTGLTSITIPKSITRIDEFAFNGCTGLTSIKVESGNTIYDSREECNAIIKTETNKLFLGCSHTKIPETVTSIGYRAFTGCTDLTSITIPNNVTEIGKDAFSGCTSLTAIAIPYRVAFIDDGAFSYCQNLDHVYCYATQIPSSYSNIFVNSNTEYVGTLHVPQESLREYSITEPWRNFKNIVALTDVELSVNDLKSNDQNSNIQYYTLNGLKVLAGHKGVLIVRSADKTKKIIKK